ncbi:homoserine dehydrogenase [Dehalococcoides mccartyi]|uniref:Homoserine dehydrogenase n=1 Tax=Dehalococcoides mccartyi (strain ATCC BAA-2266 / KCTC 15142 / 195) TaxID=243164 RepID=Q3Z780_DEHM1|nr:homoserine dehydrogenase [Dehalococcoides mccartyi]AAW39540.1 homoserine dehydrogenase [Dehalococcoides mccartyi 195]
MEKEYIGVGVIGLGVVAGQVSKVLHEREEFLSAQLGFPLKLKKVKVLPQDMSRPLAKLLPEGVLTTDEDDFFNTPGLDIVVEAIGGEYPAFNLLSRGLKMGKCVVTSNKEVIAKHAPELVKLARENNTGLRCEASVGGGIPLISPFQYDLAANHINGIYAIINGTTNYILTRMAKEGLDFETALKQAQSLGYAEANPSNDIEGTDAVYKLAIMASINFQCKVKPEDIYREGISRLTSRDFCYADELGFNIKLLAITKPGNGQIEARVHPVFLPKDEWLAKVDGVFNAVLVEGDLVGPVLFQGQGAGASATSSAVVADVLAAAQDIHLGVGNRMRWNMDKPLGVKPMSDILTRYYLRMTVTDSPGVLALIARVLGDHNISISSVIQKETDEENLTAEIVIMTHPAKEAFVQQALVELGGLDKVKDINNFVRVGI